MSTFEFESMDPALRNYIDRKMSKALIESFRDSIVERAIFEATARGPVSTYTFYGETEQQIAIVHGICPAPTDDTIVVVHNEIKPNTDKAGGPLMAALSAWTIDKAGVGFWHEAVYGDEDGWDMSYHVPLIQSYADESTDGEIALHLPMNSHVIDPYLRVPFGENIRASKDTLNSLARGYLALNLCTETTYNEHVTKLA